jgi:hypothetical protein
MGKEVGATSLNNSGLQGHAQDRTIAIVHDSGEAETPRMDPTTRLHHLGPRTYAPHRRARSAATSTHFTPESLDERLPLFLESDRQETEQQAAAARTEQEFWDEGRLSSDHSYSPRPRMDPEVPEPPIEMSSRSAFPAFIVRAGLMTLVAAAIAGTVVFRQDVFRIVALLTADAKLPLSWMSASNKDTQVSSLTPFGSRFEGHPPTQVEPPAAPAPKLVASQAPPRGPGEACPLGVSLYGASSGVSLVVGGLANGATLSAGRVAGDSTWRLTAADLKNVAIQPPHDFTGAMDLTVELRKADDTVSDRRSLRFQWAEPAVADLMAAGDAIHPLPPDEIASLLKRADNLIASGDIAAARLVLRRAAEAGDGRAAVTLAGTYDPAVLGKLGVHGVVADVAMAQAWYEKARKFGSAEARQRIEALASKRQ